jgi:hypothetical protein
MEFCLPLFQFSFNEVGAPPTLRFSSVMLKAFTLKVKGEMVVALAGDIHLAG